MTSLAVQTGLGLLLVVLFFLLPRRRARRTLAKIRAEWGLPRDRVRRMTAIAEYHNLRTADVGLRATLDDRTWEDLNLDAVFSRIDRTESTLGQQALYHRLRSAPLADHLDAFEALIDRFATHVDERERAQIALAHLQNPAGYDLWWLAQPGVVDRRPWHIVFPLLALIMIAAIAAIPVWPAAFVVALAGAVVNLVVRVVTARRIGTLVGAFRQLGPLMYSARSLQFVVGPDNEPILGHLSADVQQLRRLSTIARWVGRDPLLMVDLAASAFEYFNLLFLLDVNAIYFGAGELKAKSASLLRVIAAVGEIDAAISVASLRAGSREWIRPVFVAPDAPTRLCDVRHPLLDICVPNSIELEPSRGVLVTGSNMSGKTTFIRTVGVAAVMAQTINTCLATAYHAPVFRIRSCIGRADDLQQGKSYYLVEVEAVLAMVKASGSSSPNLYLFDELFRGTNAVERIAAAEAVLNELVASGAHRKPHVVVVATHDGELVDLLRDNFDTYHFKDSLGPNGLMFEHLLQPGPATTRNAIELLKWYGASDEVVARAFARASQLDRQRDALARRS